MPGPRTIYVQIDIAGPIDRLWEVTQTPELHRRWDLRFTDIQYLPRPDPAQPQRFLYATRIGFGLRIRGEGETVGVADAPDGTRTSALKFASDDPKSLIRAGSGYWKYIPIPAEPGEPARVRFLTAYTYSVRLGVAGRAIDRFAFRPLMGWATAWSFDRLRLWVERGIDPALALRRAATYTLARVAVAFVWLYHGLVPKLLFPSPDELTLLTRLGLSDAAARVTLPLIGVAELILTAVLVFAWRRTWPLWATLILMPLALVPIAITSPHFLAAAFNPVSLNACVFALAAVALLNVANLPSAGRCVRTQPSAEAP
jgi:hypothetical protein